MLPWVSALLGFASEGLVRGFSRTPPTRFANLGLATKTLRRLGVSIGIRLARSAQPGKPGDRTDSPFRVLAPERSRTFDESTARVIGWPCAAPCIAADRPARFGRPTRSAGAARETSEVPSISRCLLLLRISCIT
jgi:hypothetical protein